VILSGQVLRVSPRPQATPTIAANNHSPSADMALARGFQYLFVVEQLPNVGVQGTHLMRKVAVVPKVFSGTTNKQLLEWKEGRSRFENCAT
jgi:hypothetical protein